MKLHWKLIIVSIICIAFLTILLPFQTPKEPPPLPRITRSEALKISSNFLGKIHLTEVAAKSLIYITYEEDSAFDTFYYTYINMGYTLNDVIEILPVKRWLIRYFYDNMVVTIGVDGFSGKIVFFKLFLRGDDVSYGENIGFIEAYSKASDFLSYIDLKPRGSWKLIVNGSKIEDGVKTYTFVWMVNEWPLALKGSLEEKIFLKVKGSNVVFYKYNLTIPPEYYRKIFLEMYSLKPFLPILSTIVFILLLVPSIILFLRRYSSVKPLLKPTLLLMLILAIAFLAEGALTLDSLIFEFPEDYPTNLILFESLITIVLNAATYSLAFIPALLAAFLLEKDKKRLYILTSIARRMPVDSSILLKKVTLGYFTAAVALLISTSFFMVAEMLFKVVYSSFSLINQLYASQSSIGYIFVLSLSAALLEETLFRALSINLFLSNFKRESIAVFCSSLIWSLLHLGYPIYPLWVKSFQIFLVGIIVGYVYLEWGFETVLTYHYVFNLFTLSLSTYTLFSDMEKYIFFMLLFLPFVVVFALTKIHNKFFAKTSLFLDKSEDPYIGAIREHLHGAKRLMDEGKFLSAFTLTREAFKLLMYKVIGGSIREEKEAWKRFTETPFYKEHTLTIDLVKATLNKYEIGGFFAPPRNELEELLLELEKLIEEIRKT
ncbi:MAG: CPBP family intramembrane metalloprotease [Thermoproteales archaeon]|nr:CPBP family intramembrane metalloprotease [Thermoproteales archaeon]